MKYSYVVRLTIPFSEVLSFIDQWSEKADKLLVYEHEADQEVSQTHCHFLIQDCKIGEDRLKQIVNQKREKPLKGNECWSWKAYDPGKGSSYMAYMTKGKLACKYSKNYSADELERARQAWVEPVLGNDKHPGTPMKKKKDEITELYDSFIKKHDINDFKEHSGFTDMICDKILGLCRTHTMSHVYHTTGKLPFPGTYKQTAGTLFLRVIETKRPDLFEEALNSLKNIWY